MVSDLTLKLARAGLVQFGRFERAGGDVWPVMVNLLWLPSYPALLRDVAAALQPLLEGIAADRMLTTVDALPIGVALSLRADIPLVYPYGEVRDYTAAFAIEGAYDVGHPTLLLSDVLIDAPQANQITALARKVGLEIHRCWRWSIWDSARGRNSKRPGIPSGVCCGWARCCRFWRKRDCCRRMMRETVEEWLARGR